jgi:hypothetical protein
MNKTLVIVAGVVAIIGLLVNMIYAYDKAYGIQHTGSLAPYVPSINIALFLLTFILTLAGAFVGGKKSSPTSSSSSMTQQKQ